MVVDWYVVLAVIWSDESHFYIKDAANQITIAFGGKPTNIFINKFRCVALN